jgi:putative transposase
VPSNRWRTANDRVARPHTRVGNQRRDGLHQLTTRLVSEFDTIVIEDLL